MERRHLVPAILVLVWLAVIAVVVVVQMRVRKEAAFVRQAQQAFWADVGTSNISDIRCTVDTLFIDLSVPISLGEMDRMSRSFVTRFSEFRASNYTDGNANVVLLREAKEAYHAVVDNGVIATGAGPPP